MDSTFSLKRGEVHSCDIRPPLLTNEYTTPLQLYSMGIRCPQEPVYYNGVGYSFFNFCTEGQGLLNLKGKTYTITPGTGFIVTSGTVVDYYATSDVFTTYWIAVAGYLQNNIWEYKNTFFPLYNMQELIDKFYDILEIPLNDSWNIRSSCMLYEYILILNKQIRTVLNPTDKYTEMLKPAVSYLTFNISKPYDATMLANILGVSPTHMCRLFKMVYGCQPGEYAEKLKMNYAKQMLENDRAVPISSIARYCGYENTSYFISVFKKYQGIPPAQYRNTILKIKKGL